MAGNVNEWVADFYDPSYYKNSPKINPLGPGAGAPRSQRRSLAQQLKRCEIIKP